MDRPVIIDKGTDVVLTVQKLKAVQRLQLVRNFARGIAIVIPWQWQMMCLQMIIPKD